MDFVIGLPISTNWKRDSYDSILVIVDRLTNMIYYKLVKISINVAGLVEVIIDMVVCHHGFSDSIVTNRSSLFILNIWSLLCYFLRIKQKLSTAFHSQTDGQTKRQNSIMEVYLWSFANFKQNDWAKLFPIAKFAYNNAKNASTGHMPFKLNCGYHPRIFFKEDTNPHSQSKTIKKLSSKPKELMTIVGRTSTMLKSFRSELTIKGSNLGATPPVIKLDWIVNTSRPNKTRS